MKEWLLYPNYHNHNSDMEMPERGRKAKILVKTHDNIYEILEGEYLVTVCMSLYEESNWVVNGKEIPDENVIAYSYIEEKKNNTHYDIEINNKQLLRWATELEEMIKCH